MNRLPTDVTSALEMMRFGCPLDKPLGDPDVAYFERRMLKAADILEAAVRQSLSQEGVRDEALAEALACPRPQVVGEHACKNRKQCWEPCGDLGHHEEYALKHEPNAAGPRDLSNQFDAIADVLVPAPAAPDVATLMAEWLEAFAEGLIHPESPFTLREIAQLRKAAALLAKLGQGWIPVDRTAEYQEHHFKVEDVGVAWNGNRVWVCADSGALLRAKVMGEKLFVEFTPPAPRASDE